MLRHFVNSLSSLSVARTFRPIHTSAVNLAFSFELTEDQRSYQELARNFTREQIIPNAPHFDRTGEYPLKLIEKAWKLGLVNTDIPEQYGGPGLCNLDSVIVGECLSFGCTGGFCVAKESYLPLLFQTNSYAESKHCVDRNIHCDTG